MISRFLLFATLLSLSVCQLSLRLSFQRSGLDQSGNIITLMCFNEQGMAIDLGMNNSIKFFVNRTFEHDEQSLDELERVQLFIQETSASFQITPELEGNYACGIVGAQRGTGTSDSMPLVVLPTNEGLLERREIYASGGREARIPCTFHPGMLYYCYFGEWFKNETKIFSIGKPNTMTCGNSPGRDVENTNTSKYRVDEKTFELIISSVNANDDSGEYRCQLYVLNPASMHGETHQFRSMPVNLTIDAQPNISETGAPTDVIVGVEQPGMGLLETAMFECVALGRPAPDINWFYTIVNQDGTVGTKKKLSSSDNYNIVATSSDEDETRRFQRRSILTMSVTENDGGIVGCQAGASSKNAYLTVLSRPSINIITSLRGEIVYTIRPTVHLNRPVKLNFTYQDAESRTIYNRDSQPVEIYNDTNEITYRENRDHVPGKCTKCHVTVALTGQIGSQVVQGLSVTSSDVIDLEARTPQQTIDRLNTIIIVTCVVLASIIIIILVIIIAVVIHVLKKRVLRQKKDIALGRLHSIAENVTDLGDNINDEAFKREMVSRIKGKLKKLEEYITTEFDSVSSDAPQVDLKQVDKSLAGLLSKFEK